MSEEIKLCAQTAAKTLDSIPMNKREMAARLAETYAAGLAVGLELAEADRAAAPATKSEEGASAS